MKVRQDAWSQEDDLLLAKTVLQHIQKGSTQVAAFEEVGDRLNRTSAACGYRWNAEVRKNYKIEVEKAKIQRKQNSKEKDKELSQHEINSSDLLKKKTPIPNLESGIPITLNDCITFLSHELTNNDHDSQNEQIKLKRENEMLKKKHTELESKYEKLLQRKQYIEHDYKLLMSMLSQAQKMTEDTTAKKYYN
ncbi:RsfA family transcriptional regulator [Metabacillus litoralis]|uniref:RsfA family transcriptional regulator n=1 Tax=Metabacillus litoralis TaxID=152268 RepID=UPI001CFDA3A2|nr:RsfA family transcriptional regulator [Metabacillus litoralis]